MDIRERGIQEVGDRDLGHKWGHLRQCWLSKDMEVASPADNNKGAGNDTSQGWMGPQLRPCQGDKGKRGLGRGHGEEGKAQRGLGLE